jgi:rubrerythrin
VSTLLRSHSDRAAIFKQHASNTKSPDTREMYLRLAKVEMALAAKEAELVEQTEQQAPREVEDQDAAPTTPGESPLPISDEN